MTSGKEQIIQELDEIRKSTGTLHPKDVVDFARNPETALHSKFEWDDGAAAENYRIWQARQVIRVTLKYLDTGEGEEFIRAFVNVVESEPDYVRTEDILDDPGRRTDLILILLRRMKDIDASYLLPELKPVRVVIDQLMVEFSS